MARQLSYADALRLLGKDDSTVLDFAGKLADAALGGLGVPDLGGLRGLVLQHGRAALARIRDKISGVSRYDRTQRIGAAHRIIVTTAYFEALGELLDAPSSPLSLADLEITGEEQERLVEGPSSHYRSPYQEVAALRLRPRYTHGSALNFVSGLAAWDRLDESQQSRIRRKLTEELPALAEHRYHEAYLRLAADIPEFGVWANHAEHQATRERIGEFATGLAGLERVLRTVSPGARAGRRAEEMVALYRRALDRPVLNAADVPEGFTLPPLREAYLNPRGRLAMAMSSDQPSHQGWWERWPVQSDIQTPLAALLTTLEATQRPTVILGHPGAGKSRLTEMLAARLPAGDFLPVRVELRTVHADAPIHRQIEQALSATLHTDVAWRDLAESAEGALPVVLLDGLDELLQATGVNRSDYLEQVQAFQETQEALGHPVAVIVTSRTVVADRVRFPPMTTVIRLEPFDDGQIARMLRVWNTANEAALAEHHLRPLPLEVALRHRELAEQPLLLLMLLLYDTDGNTLQCPGTDLSRADLYERLLTSFTSREIAKHDDHLDEAAKRRAVEEEMRRLEVTALAMFARRRQHVTAEELGGDLDVLAPPLPQAPRDAGLHGRLGTADRVLGRFFFVHESRARQEGTERSVYEFLHATFGEFLVARMMAATLRDLVAARAQAARRRFAAPLDDGPLHAVTSFAAVVGRTAVVEFLDDQLRAWFAGFPKDRAACRALLLELFHEAPYPSRNRTFTEYEPVRLPVTTRQGVHTANLVALLVLVSEEEYGLTELFPDASDPLHEWRGLAGLWRGLPSDEWHGMVDTLRVRHLDCWDGEQRATLERETGQPVDVGECVGFELRGVITDPRSIANPYGLTVPFEGTTSKLLRSMAIRVNGSAGRMVLMLLPYLAHVSTDLGAWLSDGSGPDRVAWAEAHDVLELCLAPPHQDPDERIGRYQRLLAESTTLGWLEFLVLRRAAEELDLRLSAAGVSYRPLSRCVNSYLRRVEAVTVAVSPPPAPDPVTPVLERLREHVPPPVLDAVAGLVAKSASMERRRESPSAGPAGPKPRSPTAGTPLPEREASAGSA